MKNKLFDVRNSKKVINRIGREYWIWNTDTLYEQRMARENGPYQARNLVFNRKHLPNARTIIDIGANIGMNTIEYATWAKDVKAFEPMKSSLELMKLNIEIAKNANLKGRYWDTTLKKNIHNPDHPDGWFKFDDGSFAPLDLVANIELFEFALGAENDSVVMEQKTAECSRGDAILKTGKASRNPLQLAQQRTLDSFNFQDVDLIKVDIEGTELFALMGAVETIKKWHPVIQVELRDTHCKKFNYHPNDIIDLIMSLGDYRMVDFKGNDLGKEFVKVPFVMDRFFVRLKDVRQED